jgi:hypothetical protein
MKNQLSINAGLLFDFTPLCFCFYLASSWLSCLAKGIIRIWKMLDHLL